MDNAAFGGTLELCAVLRNVAGNGWSQLKGTGKQHRKP